MVGNGYGRFVFSFLKPPNMVVFGKTDLYPDQARACRHAFFYTVRKIKTIIISEPIVETWSW